MTKPDPVAPPTLPWPALTLTSGATYLGLSGAEGGGTDASPVSERRLHLQQAAALVPSNQPQLGRRWPLSLTAQPDGVGPRAGRRHSYRAVDGVAAEHLGHKLVLGQEGGVLHVQSVGPVTERAAQELRQRQNGAGYVTRHTRTAFITGMLNRHSGIFTSKPQALNMSSVDRYNIH